MDNGKLGIMRKTAERIRHLRTIKGLSQESLALSAGLNPAFLGHIERCIKCPTIDTINKITCALNISLSDFFNFHEERKDESSNAVERITLALHGLPQEDADSIASIVDEIVRLRKGQANGLDSR